MRFTILSFLITAVIAAPGISHAGKKAGVSMPDTIIVAQRPLVLNGMGLREATMLKIDVYVAGLYLEHASSNSGRIVASSEVKRLVLRFVRDVDRDDILEAWHDGFKHNATVPLATLKPQIDRLDAWMPAFSEGDTLTFTYVPGEGVTVEVNGKARGVLKGDDFARSLFSIWLGPRPPTDDLKRGLIGNHTEVP
ncbi:MAG TPA: chalcone isomerase family protein [Kofleriaceae bacterium]|nr:chalcone isomerase family protein [Kofleriaceae bacterium]